MITLGSNTYIFIILNR